MIVLLPAPLGPTRATTAPPGTVRYADFDIDAIRAANAADGYRPKLVFTSSLAVFGPPFPKVIPDDHILRPASSYGVQKAMGELMLADYARRGFLDGIGLREISISSFAVTFLCDLGPFPPWLS